MQMSSRLLNQFCLITICIFYVDQVIGAELAKTKSGNPNIIVIMVDNLGYGDLGSYGGIRAETPRIDQLAAEGVRFLDFQVEAGSLISRAAFQTGRMPVRSGLTGHGEPGAPWGLHPKEITLGELLKTVGYSTALYGKWHLGSAPERQPQMQGYDEWYGLNLMVPVDHTLPGANSLTIDADKILYAVAGTEAKAVGENTIDMRSRIDREITQKSISYVQAQSETDEPFFLLVSLTNPHHPVVPHPDFEGRSRGGAYTDVLMETDYNVGQILDAVDESKIRGNTIVVFISDNGPSRYSPEADHNGDPGIWSGDLGSGWEGSLRTVGMMRWPGKIRANWKTKEMFSLLDFYATFSTITGAQLPTDRPIDSIDQSSFLLGKQALSSRDSRLAFYGSHEEPIAVRYKQFKYHFVVYGKVNAYQSGSVSLEGIPYIYNLDTDPKEMYNLFGRSGAGPLYGLMYSKVLTPYYVSLKEHPNGDYSKMKRER
jgi:arylsulfatase